MNSKQHSSRRALVAETLEKRELLAANLRGSVATPQDTEQANAATIAQRATPCVLAEASRAQAIDGIANAAMVTAARRGNGGGGGGGMNNSDNRLNQSEIDQLLFMREEEKLARDVYLALAENTNARIFDNIAASEQKHMDAVERLINKYRLEDPVKDDTPGVFANTTLQRLYNDLVSDGEVQLDYLGLDLVIEGGATSPMAALQVGAFIEELDILDLRSAIASTTRADVVNVYESLLKGSRNHLRAFVGQIEKRGETYDPVLMTGELYERYEEIVSSDREQGSGNQQNDRNANGNRNAGVQGVRSNAEATRSATDDFFARFGQGQGKGRWR